MRFYPEPPPVVESEDARVIIDYLHRQLLLISGEQIHDLDKMGQEPEYVTDGMIRYANGDDWNPSAGEGAYIYFNNRWNYISTTPSDGAWEDYTSDLAGAKPGLTNPPDWATFRDGIVMPAFSPSVEEDVFINFHILHDLLVNDDSKLHLHMHWSPGNSTNTGTVRWGFEFTYALGHQQEAFAATQTVYIEQAATGTEYMHQIAEVSYEDAIASTELETDAIVSVRVFRDATHANDTFTGDAYGFQVDIHYLRSGRTGTRNKAPDFDNHEFNRPSTGVFSITGGTPTVT